MSTKKDFPSKLKGLGIEVYNAAKKEYKAVVSGAGKQIRKDKLRKRFNLENPYRFVLLDSKIRVKLFDGLMAKHAKRYDEDDILVFFGSKDDNNFQAKQHIKDLSDETIYEILEIIDVTMPVKCDETVVEVPCAAIYGKVL
jgi:hypothetical protein